MSSFGGAGGLARTVVKLCDGTEIRFTSERQQNTWMRLHSKRCVDCRPLANALRRMPWAHYEHFKSRTSDWNRTIRLGSTGAENAGGAVGCAVEGAVGGAVGCAVGGTVGAGKLNFT